MDRFWSRRPLDIERRAPACVSSPTSAGTSATRDCSCCGGQRASQPESTTLHRNRLRHRSVLDRLKLNGGCSGLVLQRKRKRDACGVAYGLDQKAKCPSFEI
jgi:hypothetical protein